MKKYLTFLAMVLMMGLGTVRAQDQQPVPQDQQSAPQDQQAPPPDDQSQVAVSGGSNQGGPGVARLSFIHGKVSTQRGDNGDWVGVTLNTPIMSGDRVSTGDDSKAELQLDWANVLRMSSDATVKVANLTRNSIQIQVGRGLVTYSVLPGAEAAAEIDTPNAAVRPSAEGEYRILVNSDGESIAIVRRGGADVSTPQGSTHVNEGQMITIQGTDNPQYKIDPAPGRDDWDSWNYDRDRVINRAEGSNNHTNRYYVGSQDLDTYGKWENVPDYGQVWVPNEGADWAPYRDGRWVWEPYYGWTWIGYEPWGWAPYHYGRWFVYGGNWAWWPGPVYAYPGYYPIWSPAYVSFFGWGGGWGFGLGFGFGFGWGHVGWLPVGPGDWYHPWWGRWGGGVNVVAFDRINGLHEGFGPLGRSTWHQYSNFNEAFRNDRIRSGISSMEGRDFGRTAVSAHQERINESTLRNASMSTGRMPIQPGRESYSPTGRAADPRSYSHAPSSSQHFFTASRTNGSPNGFAARASANSASRPANTSRQSAAFNNARAGNSFDRPSNATGNADRGNAITSSRSGWHTFTPPSSANTDRGTNGATNNSSRGFEGQRSNPAYGNGQYESRRYSNSSRGGYYSGRPSLNMRQPIVTPRSNGYGSYGSRGYGYGAPRPSNSQPRPSYSAPRSNSAPRGNSGGGSSHSGGGHPSGGGGHGHGR
jgi:FecR protein